MHTRLALAALMLTAATAAHASTLRFCSEGSPAFFDPAQSNSGTDFDVQTALFDTLVDIARGTQTRIPGLATAWDISPDGLTYTFHLRPGVKFHTTPWFKPTRDLNADDVVFTYQRLLDRSMPFRKAYPTESAYVGDLAWDKLIASVEKLDPLTVRFKLREPNAPFINGVSATFTSIHSAEYAAQLLKAGKPHLLNTQPVGTGPFIFKSAQKDSNVRMVRNPDFWRPEVYRVDNLIYIVTTDRNVRSQKLKAGECDISALASQNDATELRMDPNIQVISSPGSNIGYLSYQVRRPPLDKLEVRQALDMAIDKKRLVEAVFQGAGTVANSSLPGSNWAHDGKLAATAYDPQKALELLKKAGVSNLTISLWRIPVQRAYNPNGALTAEMIQADWAKIGVKAHIVTYEWGEYIKRMNAGEHEAGMAGWNADAEPNGVLSLLVCDGGNNNSKWCNTAYDELVLQGRRTTDREKRKVLYASAQKIVAEQVPWSVLGYGNLNVPARKNVIGFKLPPGGTMRFDGVEVK
ncbi:MAG: ABC transporter substrate-binding protein [Rhodoferax sp.]|nr:ABC transporter substrate-binding protein [Rhodoferax sp.]